MYVPFFSSSLATSAGVVATQSVVELPTDPAALVVLAIVLTGVCAVIWFGRPRGGGTP